MYLVFQWAVRLPLFCLPSKSTGLHFHDFSYLLEFYLLFFVYLLLQYHYWRKCEGLVVYLYHQNVVIFLRLGLQYYFDKNKGLGREILSILTEFYLFGVFLSYKSSLWMLKCISHSLWLLDNSPSLWIWWCCLHLLYTFLFLLESSGSNCRVCQEQGLPTTV